jgi:hypothetical protein
VRLPMCLMTYPSQSTWMMTQRISDLIGPAIAEHKAERLSDLGK